jgi:DNA-binding CsgD family transcriptional regulator
VCTWEQRASVGRLAGPDRTSYDRLVASDTESLLGAAHRAMEAGDWSTAKSSFEAALEREETAEALVGLGDALWWLEEIGASLRYRERAYAAFRRRPDPVQAAMLAGELAAQYGGSLGNRAAARGWLARQERLVEEFELAALEGWVLLGRAASAAASGDPQAAESFARRARECARRFVDADLELCALSEIGGALVEMGRLDEGTALLDEAMAGALGGEGERPETIVHTSCKAITSCSRAFELKRAAQWVRAAEAFNRRYGSAHLYAVCRTHYGGVLLATGKWAEAEDELQVALEVSTAAEPVLHAEALAKLAELRLAQGRIAEATRLLDGVEDHHATTYALGLIHLARGEPTVAASILRRRLDEIGEECLECAALLELLTEATLQQGEIEAAMRLAQRLAELGATLGCEMIVARGERALGRALGATPDRDGASSHLGRALEAFARLEMPLETGRTRLLLAAAIGATEREAAIAEARRALATFEELGADRDADQAAAVLRSLGVRAARSGPRGLGGLTKRELEVLGLLGEGLSNREIAARLFLARKTVEHHVASVLSKLELSGRGEATAYAVRHLER